MVDATKDEVKQRQNLGELFSKQLTASIITRSDDLIRISRKAIFKNLLSIAQNEGRNDKATDYLTRLVNLDDSIENLSILFCYSFSKA